MLTEGLLHVGCGMSPERERRQRGSDPGLSSTGLGLGQALEPL